MPGCLSSLHVITVCMAQPPSKRVGLNTFVMLFGAGRLLASLGRKELLDFQGLGGCQDTPAGTDKLQRPHEQISLETGELRCLLGLPLATLTAEPDRYGTINPNEI